MGRFFKTSNNDYSIDYGFNPDLKEIIPMVQDMNKKAQEDMEALTILNDVPVEYIDEIDKENALNIKAQYDNLVTNLVQQAVNNPNGLLQLRAGIKGAQALYKKDLETGRIKRLAENKKYYEARQAEIEKMKDPESREIAKKVWQDYVKNNPYGTMESKLELDQYYEKRNLYEDFLNSAAFKAIEPDMVSWETDKNGGLYIYTNGGQRKSIPFHKIDQAFRTWANAEVKGYGKYFEKYGGQKFFNENGELEFDKKGYVLNDVLKAALKATKGSVVSNTYKIGTNQVGVMQWQHEQAKQQVKEEKDSLHSSAVSSIGYRYLEDDIRKFGLRDILGKDLNTENISPRITEALNNPNISIKDKQSLQNYISKTSKFKGIYDIKTVESLSGIDLKNNDRLKNYFTHTIGNHLFQTINQNNAVIDENYTGRKLLGDNISAENIQNVVLGLTQNGNLYPIYTVKIDDKGTLKTIADKTFIGKIKATGDIVLNEKVLEK